MATGLTEWGGTAAQPDVRGAGDMEWSTVSGVSPESPMVGGPHVMGLGERDVDRGRSVIVTVPGSGDSATGAGATTPGMHLLDDWRDLFNLKGSPMPGLLLLALAMLGFMQIAAQARVGPVRASAGVG
jgi:hypothetical protein